MAEEVFGGCANHDIAARKALYLRHLAAELGHFILTDEVRQYWYVIDPEEFKFIEKADCKGKFKQQGEYGDVIHLRLLATLLNTKFMVLAEEYKPPKWHEVLPLPLGDQPPVLDKRIYLMLKGQTTGGHYRLLKNITPYRSCVKVR